MFLHFRSIEGGEKMTLKNTLPKVIGLLLLVIFFASTSTLAYSYFDSLNKNTEDILEVGDWMTAISTPQEFYDFATKLDSDVGDRYYLENDIDFTGFTWELDNTNHETFFRGILDGDGHTISNLTIFTDNSTYNYLGIFTRIKDGTVKNLKLDNVNMVLDSSIYFSKTYRTGLIAGDVQGNTTVSNITITNSSVMANKGAGAGGVIGYILGTTSNVTINNIKATGLQVFSVLNNCGGIVGQINKDTLSVYISDIEVQADIYNSDTPSYVGGIVGKSEAGAALTIERAIVEMNPQNTFVTDLEYLDYSRKYNGGIVGYNLAKDLIVLNCFFTGNLITELTRTGDNIGTVIGRNIGTYTLTNCYYSQVQFLNVNGSILYTPDPTSTGVFGTVVNVSTMPSVAWWTTFFTNFDNGLWAQDANGRLHLIR